MRLGVTRDSVFTRAAAALLILLVCGSAFDWGHLGGDDRDCDIVVVHHDHSAHRLSTGAVTSRNDDHCYICHSLRLLHHVVGSRYERVSVAAGQRMPRLDGDAFIVREALRAAVASRAPPSIRL